MRIDSHHHFWNYSVEEYGWINDDMSVLKRDFGPDDLKEVGTAGGVNAVISVQARQSLDETNWLLSIADQNDYIAGVVGWVPLASPDVEQSLASFSDRTKLKAVRHVVQDEPDDAFILGTEFNRGVSYLKNHNLVYDILIFAKHLENSIKFVDNHPEQAFVLDHIAKPTIQSARFDEKWATDIRELAKRENVKCKFSGVVTEVRDETWEVETIQPYWDVAIEAFGPNRLMYGSDWPVCLLKSDYARWITTVEELASGLSAAEQQQFWFGTAQRAYNLV